MVEVEAVLAFGFFKEVAGVGAVVPEDITQLQATVELAFAVVLDVA